MAKRTKTQATKTIHGYAIAEMTDEVAEAGTWCGNCGKCDADTSDVSTINLDGPVFVRFCYICNNAELLDK